MIPDYQTLMLPFLQNIMDGKEHSIREMRGVLARHFKLTDDELNLFFPSGNQLVFHSRSNWAKSYLKLAGLIEYTTPGCFRITEDGKQALAQKPQKIDTKFLLQFSKFQQKFNTAKQGKNKTEPKIKDDTETSATPEETITNNYIEIRRNLGMELLSKIMEGSPAFFERLVVELLVKMGYGGTVEEAGEAIGRSGDEGIDGIIKEDRLGLDVIYIQAKRWNKDRSIGRGDLQAFVGALVGRGAKKGVFITTSQFAKSAVEYVSKIEHKIALVDGEQLANLMMDYDLAVATTQTFIIKRIDNDYFDGV